MRRCRSLPDGDAAAFLVEPPHEVGSDAGGGSECVTTAEEGYADKDRRDSGACAGAIERG